MLAWPRVPAPRFTDEQGLSWVSTRGALLHVWTPWVTLLALGLVVWAMGKDGFPILAMILSALTVIAFAWRYHGSGKYEALAWRIREDGQLAVAFADGGIRALGRVETHEPVGKVGWFRWTRFTHWTWRFPKQKFGKGDQNFGIIGKLISPQLSLGLFTISADLMIGDYQGRHGVFYPCLHRPETCALVTLESGATWILTARTEEALRAGLGTA
ncbi:MAG TPA: hypothetical protein VJ505_01035 [Holophagaceae bacterium]|nr:hypothetical protein [Holophagaceae bacterium]